MMQTNEITPVVHVKDGQVFANSRDVAEFFGKRHDHLLEKIGLIFSRTPDRASPNFRACLVEHPAVPGRLDRTYDMTKDGFTFLVMGFTGGQGRRVKAVGPQGSPIGYPQGWGQGLRSAVFAYQLDPLQLLRKVLQPVPVPVVCRHLPVLVSLDRIPHIFGNAHVPHTVLEGVAQAMNGQPFRLHPCLVAKEFVERSGGVGVALVMGVGREQGRAFARSGQRLPALPPRRIR